MKNLGSYHRRLVQWPALALAAAVILLTGCPHNEYVVQLKPQGGVIERTLDFYGADGMNTNTGTPNYTGFNAAELAAITALYPAGGVTNEGVCYTAHGWFTNQLPADVGGAGAYLHYDTSLGEAGAYTERFRGSDDFSGMIERHNQAADRLADLCIGWSRSELGREPGYESLHRFLDVDFRRDLKNIGAYWWAGQLAAGYQTNAPEEFVVRFGQYLWEHGYFKIEEIPGLFKMANDGQSQGMLVYVRRWVAGKMGVPETSPALACLADESAAEKSWNHYLAGTELYQAKLKQWETEKQTKPDAKRPEPSEVMGEALTEEVGFNIDTPDHLAVKLALAAPPLHTNGRWDEAARQVVWQADLEGRTNALRIPVMCYACWAQPDGMFQTNHFGKTMLAGDALTEYCLWRNSLDAGHGRAWDAFVASLQPGAGLGARVGDFRFAGEPSAQGTNAPAAGLSASGRELLQKALE